MTERKTKPLTGKTVGQMVRFGIVGVLATAVHYGVYWLLQLFINVNVAYTAGYLVSLALNYVLSARFTFRQEASVRSGIGFGLAHLSNYLLHMVLFNFFLWMGLSRAMAPFAVLAIAIPVNFFLVRFAFRGPAAGEADEPHDVRE